VIPGDDDEGPDQALTLASGIAAPDVGAEVPAGDQSESDTGFEQPGDRPVGRKSEHGLFHDLRRRLTAATRSPEPEPRGELGPIRIPAGSREDALELRRGLAARGLPGRLVGKASRWEVFVGSHRERADALLAEIEPALTTWLAERGIDHVAVSAGSSVVAVVAGPEPPD